MRLQSLVKWKQRMTGETDSSETKEEYQNNRKGWVKFSEIYHYSSNTGYLVTQPIRIAYFQHVIALDQSEGWI